jgi:hypothetical protein
MQNAITGLGFFKVSDLRLAVFLNPLEDFDLSSRLHVVDQLAVCKHVDEEIAVGRVAARKYSQVVVFNFKLVLRHLLQDLLLFRLCKTGIRIVFAALLVRDLNCL